MPCPNCGEDDAPLGLFFIDTDTDMYEEGPCWDFCMKCDWEHGQEIESKEKEKNSE